MARSLSRAASRLVCVFAAALALFALPISAAHAAEAPSDSTPDIEATLMADCDLHQQGCVFNGGYISTVDPLYAFASATGSASRYDAVLYRNTPGGSDWTVLVAETDQPRGCSEYTDLGVPDVALDDLSITGRNPGSTDVVKCGKPAPIPKDCGSFKHERSIIGVEALRSSCSKARALIMWAANHPGKTPKGWVNMAQTGCSGYLVPKKYRGIQFPLAELPSSQPLIFLSIAIGTCASSDTAPPNEDGAAYVVPGLTEVSVPAGA